MPVEINSSSIEIPGKLVELILQGPTEDRRQLQDSPILGDVWLACAADPAGLHDLLITPHREVTAGQLAKEISKPIRQARQDLKRVESAGIAHLQGIVAARLYFDEILRFLVPVTQWWFERKVRGKLEDYQPADIGKRIKEIFEMCARRDEKSLNLANFDMFTALERYVALAGLVLWASAQRRPENGKTERPTVDELLERIKPHIEEIVGALLSLFGEIVKDRTAKPDQKLIFQVSLNRRAMPALDRSVPAVKADAAQRLFGVECKKIAWAVLDAGIQSDHPAFKDKEGALRIKKTFDFTRIREIVCGNTVEQKVEAGLLDDVLLKQVGIKKSDARKRLEQLTKEADEGRPLCHFA